MRSVAAAVLALAGCDTGPGTLVSPVGTVPLRTALYRVGIFDGAPELAIVLTNGEIECGLPNFVDDTSRQAEAVEGMVAAACREGAQHAVLHLYNLDAGWTGRFVGLDGATADDLGADDRRLSRGVFYGIGEAFLVEIEGLERGYASSEEVFLDSLGDGGEVDVIEEHEDRLTGWFSFPADGVEGEFSARHCTGDTSLVDKVAANPLEFCR